LSDAPGGTGLGGLDAEALSQLAHHLKNPLAAILGYAELLRTRNDESIRRDAPVRIHEAATRLSYAVDDLVTALSLNAGTLELDPEPIELDAVVGLAIEEIAGMPGEKSGASIYRRDWVPCPAVEMDGRYLQRIVVNVLLAAARVSPEGSEVNVRGAPNGASAEISVTARGRLADEHQHAWGTGLGLANAVRLVELHGGTVTTDKGADGTTFRLMLPVAAQAAGS
jgi:signal transduction histidine kinase